MLDLEELEGRINLAHEMVSALCHGEREWIMSVPARFDYDPDLVIGNGLRAGDQAIARVRVLEAIVERLEVELEQHNNPFNVHRMP